jgi:hypothetical protein
LDLARRVNQVEQRLGELELEWIDKRDALDLLQRRLAIRERRAAAAGDGDDRGEPVPPAPAPANGDKAAMRRYARERGLIR